MSADNYAASLRRVLVHEGGFSNHPRDPGGATMKGVTQRVYDAYRQRHNLPDQSVRNISQAELEAVYRTQYADKIAFDKLPAGIDYVVFDGAVNSGPMQAVKWLQRAVGVKDDGLMGNVTLAAVNSRPNLTALIDGICDQRMRFLKALKTWPTFGNGWTARVLNVRQAGKTMLTGRDHAPMAIEAVNANLAAEPAVVEDIAKPKAPVAIPTIGAGAGVAVALNQVRDAVQPYAGIYDMADRILFYLSLGGGVIAAIGVCYGVWAHYRRKEVKAIVGPTA